MVPKNRQYIVGTSIDLEFLFDVRRLVVVSSLPGRGRGCAPCMMYILEFEDFDFEEVINMFARRNPRRMVLLDPFQGTL